MPYIPSRSFSLSGGFYIAPASSAVNFLLVANADGIIYPVPPAIMHTSSVASVPASGQSNSRTLIDYARALERQTLNRDASNDASVIADAKAPQQWGRVPVKDEGIAAGVQPWGVSLKRDGRASDSWDTVPAKDQAEQQGQQAWDGSIAPIDARASQPHNVPPAHDIDDQHYQADSAKYWEQPTQQKPGGYIPQNDFNLSVGPYSTPGALVVDFNLTPGQDIAASAVPTRPVDSVGEPHSWIVPDAIDLNIKHPWDTKPRKGTDVDFGYVVQPNPIVKTPPAQPIIRESYFYMNASSLKKLPEEIALSFANLSIKLDIDSFSWEISATILNKESMDLIRPGPSGPVEVEATVNGHVWRFMIEQYSLSRKFPKETYTVSGSSLTQLLASPYSAKTSRQIGTEKNALQIAQDVLEYTEFDIVWDASLADYTVPANVWGYESKTRLEVIDELVKASGGVVIPHMSDLEITAAHRYALGAPWDWGDLDEEVLDAIVADSIVMNYASSWQPATAYNAVYVSGVTTGVAVDVRLTGTAGDIPAPDIYDHLNLTTAQCRGRGVSVLGQSGDQEIVTIEVPLPTSGSPGLVLPAHLIEYRDTGTPANSWRGLVLETSVNVSKPGASRATQTLKIERHHY